MSRLRGTEPSPPWQSLGVEGSLLWEWLILGGTQCVSHPQIFTEHLPSAESKTDQVSPEIKGGGNWKTDHYNVSEKEVKQGWERLAGGLIGCEWKSERMGRTDEGDLWGCGESIPGRGLGLCKGPEAQPGVQCCWSSVSEVGSKGHDQGSGGTWFRAVLRGPGCHGRACRFQ